MGKSVIIFAVVVCLGLTLSAQATTVDANDEWGMTLQPGESFTCLAHFIPDIPGVADSLVFSQAPSWTSTYPFDHNTAGWNVALADGGKTAYLSGSRIDNNGPSPLDIFSYKLYYQWDNDDPGLDPNYPIYLDVVVFDDLTLTHDYSWRRTAGGIWQGPYDETWMHQYDPESEPYKNPAVPEPMTICFLSLGAAFLRRRR